MTIPFLKLGILVTVNTEVFKYIFTINQKNVPKPQNYSQTNCCSVIPMLLKSIGTTLEEFV